jgi:putative NADPH-quinone reductase
MSKKILVLFAHPSQHRSEVNLPLVRACAEVDGVTVVDLYAEYPGYCIDIEREQQRLRDHDVIVFMFPVYWYSTPAILKEWQDLVLEYGFAYGHDGTALQGKLAICAITTGGPEHAYQSSGYNHYSIRELLRPLEQTTILCGMTYLPPFTLFGSRTAVEDGKVKQHVENWKRALTTLRDSRLDLAAAATAETLNDCLEAQFRDQA